MVKTKLLKNGIVSNYYSRIKYKVSCDDTLLLKDNLEMIHCCIKYTKQCVSVREDLEMTFQEGLNQVDKAHQLIVQANEMITDATLHAFLFTWKWWISAAMLIVPWILWIIFRKKESTARLLFASFIVMLLSSTLDSVGVDYGKWSYPIKVIPLPTISYSFRYSLLPVLVMFFLQFKPSFSPFIKAIIFGGLGAYIGIPIMAMLDLYKKIDWAYTYSFFILTVMYLIAHWFSRRKSFEPI